MAQLVHRRCRPARTDHGNSSLLWVPKRSAQAEAVGSRPVGPGPRPTLNLRLLKSGRCNHQPARSNSVWFSRPDMPNARTRGKDRRESLTSFDTSRGRAGIRRRSNFAGQILARAAADSRQRMLTRAPAPGQPVGRLARIGDDRHQRMLRHTNAIGLDHHNLLQTAPQPARPGDFVRPRELARLLGPATFAVEFFQQDSSDAPEHRILRAAPSLYNSSGSDFLAVEDQLFEAEPAAARLLPARARLPAATTFRRGRLPPAWPAARSVIGGRLNA